MIFLHVLQILNNFLTKILFKPFILMVFGGYCTFWQGYVSKYSKLTTGWTTVARFPTGVQNFSPPSHLIHRFVRFNVLKTTNMKMDVF
jgi:hypothetical protein